LWEKHDGEHKREESGDNHVEEKIKVRNLLSAPDQSQLKSVRGSFPKRREKIPKNPLIWLKVVGSNVLGNYR